MRDTIPRFAFNVSSHFRQSYDTCMDAHTGLHKASRVLLICNGEAPSRALARKLARRVDAVIAADGGANMARELGIRPDVVIGDLDSVTSGTRRHFASSLFLRVTRQDNTDFEKAMDLLAAEGAEEVVIVGMTGRRIDFTLANFSLIWQYASFMRITMLGDRWRAFPARSLTRVVSRPGTTLSLIPFGPVQGVTLKGLQYPLVDGAFTVGEVAVSNVVKKSPCSIRVSRGNLLVVVQDDLLPGDDR